MPCFLISGRNSWDEENYILLFSNRLFTPFVAYLASLFPTLLLISLNPFSLENYSPEVLLLLFFIPARAGPCIKGPSPISVPGCGAGVRGRRLVRTPKIFRSIRLRRDGLPCRNAFSGLLVAMSESLTEESYCVNLVCSRRESPYRVIERPVA